MQAPIELNNIPEEPICPWLFHLLMQAKSTKELLAIARQHELICGYCKTERKVA